MDLRDVHEQIVFQVKEHLAIVASGSLVEKIGASFEQLSTCFQALGICHLLEFADTGEFRENLVRSGHSRRYFLRKSREQGNLFDRHLGLSRTEAFLDAIASGQLSLAQDIARLSVTAWDADAEYEDDFCYYFFLQSLVAAAEEFPHGTLAATLVRFERALEGQRSARLEVCRALLSGDGGKFLEHFGELVRATRDSNENKRQALESHEFLLWPRSFVSIEGLSLLRIAELRGIRTTDEWPLCPPLARLPVTDQEFLDVFAEIARHTEAV
jgi:hypothetical protein